MSIAEARETVVAAAIYYRGTVYSVPRPGRHHDVIRVMHEKGLAGDPDFCRHQGFVTSAGRFVNRFEAANIAQASGQVLKKTNPTNQLFSEDVW